MNKVTLNGAKCCPIAPALTQNRGVAHKRRNGTCVSTPVAGTTSRTALGSFPASDGVLDAFGAAAMIFAGGIGES